MAKKTPRNAKTLRKNFAKPGWVRVTKIQAAEAQIDTAIELFFTSKDIISPHTLLFAAYGILDPLLKHRGHGEALSLDHIAEQHRDGFRVLLAEAANFFKHGTKDPAATLDYQSNVNLMWIAICSDAFKKIEGRMTLNMLVFLAWMRLWYPAMLNGDDGSAVIEPEQGRLKYPKTEPGAFWHEMRQLIERAVANANRKPEAPAE